MAKELDEESEAPAGTVPTAPVVQVSHVERAILAHFVRGASNALIARELNVAEATIKVHLRSLLRKIRASNRTRDS